MRQFILGPLLTSLTDRPAADIALTEALQLPECHSLGWISANMETQKPRMAFEHLQDFGTKSGHPNLEHAPLFLHGHSNGTGFSAVFGASAPDHIWGWISMCPDITFQSCHPGPVQVPGLVIFGQDKHFLARASKVENLAVMPALRKSHRTLWNIAVKPKTGHGRGEKTWPLV